jgi:hypothetical protein
MALDQSFVERRQFGRRKTSLHGWIVPDGRPRIACVVRNVSEGGALLEFEVPRGLPYWFTLIIESKGFEARCEVRHQSERWMGVQFGRIAKIEEPIAQWSAELIDAWSGPPAKSRGR